LGLIYGTPRSTSDSHIILTATNGIGTSNPADLRITVHAAPPSGPVVISGTCATGRTGFPFNFQLLTTGGSVATHFTVGGLPPGLSVDLATGLISGAPTFDGNFGLAVTAIDGASSTHATLQLTFISDNAV